MYRENKVLNATTKIFKALELPAKKKRKNYFLLMVINSVHLRNKSLIYHLQAAYCRPDHCKWWALTMKQTAQKSHTVPYFPASIQEKIKILKLIYTIYWMDCKSLHEKKRGTLMILHWLAVSHNLVLIPLHFQNTLTSSREREKPRVSDGL